MRINATLDSEPMGTREVLFESCNNSAHSRAKRFPQPRGDVQAQVLPKSGKD